MSTKQTYFHKDQLQNVKYSNWLKGKDDKKVAYCAKCLKTIELSNMGEQAALNLHMNDEKHFKKCRNSQNFFQPTKKVNDSN